MLSISKKDLCNILGVSKNTISVYLNYHLFEDLEKLGYRKTQKRIYGEAMKYILKHYCITQADLTLNKND